MIVLISPSKTMDFDSKYETMKTEPDFHDDAFELIKELREYDSKELASLMGISDELAKLNYNRFQTFKKAPNLDDGKQALFTYQGSVYKEIYPEDFNDQELEFSQRNLRIISGLYGLLKPLDIIQPYRLEMSIKLKLNGYKNLYEFWQIKITNRLTELVEQSHHKFLVNLASKEYFGVLNTEKIQGNVVTPVFKDFKKGQYRVIGFSAKKARGKMVRYIVKKGIQDPHELKKFTADDYRYSSKHSNDKQWVFIRD
ncbi:peroxide stress protein YaaA [Natranaerobius trueperi]|nr:peroxide stress protein YaaA [Natranaerobius trueperi]